MIVLGEILIVSLIMSMCVCGCVFKLISYKVLLISDITKLYANTLITFRTKSYKNVIGLG